MWLKEYLRNSKNARFLKSNGDRRLLILPERITDSTGLSLKKNTGRDDKMLQYFFDKPVLQHTESDKFKFCPSTTLCCENIRKERSALQPLLLGPALQLGRALPRCLPSDSPSETIWALWGEENIARALTVSLHGTLVSTWVLFSWCLSRASTPVHRQRLAFGQRRLAFGQRRRRNRRIWRRRFEGGRREGASSKEEESSKEPV